MTTIDRVGPVAAGGPFEAWRTRDIVVAAVIGVVFGVIFAAWNTLYAGLGWVPVPFADVVYGMWLVPAILAPIVIRKPGAALFAEMAAASVSALLGSQWGPDTLLSGFVQGAAAELVFAFVGYRRWSLPISSARAGVTRSSASIDSTQSPVASDSANPFCAPNPSKGCDTTRAPLPWATFAVSSVLPPSTTMHSSQNESVSRQPAILPASFSVMMMALSRGNGMSPAKPWFYRPNARPTSPRKAAGPGAMHCVSDETAARDNICAGFPTGRTRRHGTARQREHTSRCGRAGESGDSRSSSDSDGFAGC